MNPITKLAFILVALGQFIAPALPALGLGKTIGSRAVAEGIPPELPTGIFFSIWSVIFIGFLITAILNWRAPDYVTERIAFPLMMAGLGNVLWMVCAQSFGWPWLDLILLAPILYFAWIAGYRLDQTNTYDGTARSILYGVTVGLLAGWLSVAVSISVPDFGRWALDRGPTDAVWQSFWMTFIPAVSLAFVFANYISRNGWYFVALGWGLTGIIVNNWTRTETHWLAITAAIIAINVLYRRMRFGARGSYPAKP